MNPLTLHRKVYNRSRRVLHLTQHPGNLSIFRDFKGTKRYENICRVLWKGHYEKRRKLAWSLVGKHDFEIPEEKGFCLVSPGTIPVVDDVVTEARAIYLQTGLAEKYQNQRHTQTTEDLTSVPRLAHVPYDYSREQNLQNIPIEQLRYDSPFLQLACHPDLIGPISRYIGILPILYYMHIDYSPNLHWNSGSSQFFHLDNGCVKMVHVFLYLEEVSEDSGPPILVAAAASEKSREAILGKYKQKHPARLNDDEIYSLVEKRDVHHVVGKVGSMAIIDAGRCYHCGSRPGAKPRLLVQMTYISPFSTRLPLHWFWSKELKWRHLVREDSSEIQRYVLGAE